MEQLKCIIVEDEIPAAEELKYIITKQSFIKVIGMAQDGVSGFELIQKMKPDVAFIDINMPGYNGMELARMVKKLKQDIQIIFVTAYDNYAIEAFEMEALDYVLKPYEEKRIQATMNRLMCNFKSKNKNSNEIGDKIDKIIDRFNKEEKLLKKIPCECNGKIILLDIDKIHFCLIENEKTYVKIKDKKYFTHYTLQEIEKRTTFFRAHRSFLVNMDNVKEFYSWFNGTYKLVMEDLEQTEIPISRNNVKKLRELLDI